MSLMEEKGEIITIIKICNDWVFFSPACLIIYTVFVDQNIPYKQNVGLIIIFLKCKKCVCPL